jgi:hypothetical protein
MGKMRNAYKILFGKHEGKRPLGRPKRRWEDSIVMRLTEISWEVVEWIYLSQNRVKWRALINTVLNLLVP